MRQSFQPGDRVRVRDDYVPGHVRMPGYIRGKTGVVMSVSPPYPFPDAHAHVSWRRMNAPTMCSSAAPTFKKSKEEI